MNSSTVVHLVRHGDVRNPGQIFYGRLPGFPLNMLGCQQIACAAWWLSDRPVTAAYSGPLLRARQSARIIAGELGIADVTPSPLLDEVRCRYEGQPRSLWKTLGWNHYDGARPPYEQPADVLRRGLEFLADAREGHAGRQIVAVTHGDIIAFLVLWAKGLPADPEQRHRLDEFGFEDDYPGRGSVTSFTFDGKAADARPGVAYIPGLRIADLAAAA